MYQKIIGKKIFIAVGHGGKDPGAVKDNIVEAFCNLEVAVQMRDELQRHGFLVKLSREKDENDPLREEIAQCNAYQPDLAIAVHTNAGGGSGFEVFYQSTRSWENMKQSEKLASLVDKKVRNCFLSGSRGVKTRRDLGWLNEVQAPAILCENFLWMGQKQIITVRRSSCVLWARCMPSLCWTIMVCHISSMICSYCITQ